MAENVYGARVILCVFAHPDDESFMAAGVACKYEAQLRTQL